jgi:hypothetical protein
MRKTPWCDHHKITATLFKMQKTTLKRLQFIQYFLQLAENLV